MAQAGVQLAVTPDSRWEVPLPDLASATRREGFVGLGLPARWAGPDARSVCDAAGVRCHEILALVITADEERTLAYAERLAEAAATMGAPWVTTTFQVAPTAASATLVARCAAIVAEAGSTMAVEFSPIGAVPDLRDGLAVAELAGSGARVLVDTWHFSVGGSTWAELEALPVDKIAFVQFSDAPALESEDLFAETMDRRLTPGAGTFELDRFATTVQDKGFDGYVSLELLNRDLLDRPVPDTLREAGVAMRRYWS
jgi:sugar phosphate isomerase/epimerase